MTPPQPSPLLPIGLALLSLLVLILFYRTVTAPTLSLCTNTILLAYITHALYKELAFSQMKVISIEKTSITVLLESMAGWTIVKAIREMYTYLFTNEREGLWILKTVYYGAAVAAAAWCIWHVSDVLWSYHRGTTILTKPKTERPISANKKSE